MISKTVVCKISSYLIFHSELFKKETLVNERDCKAMTGHRAKRKVFVEFVTESQVAFDIVCQVHC